MDAGPGSLVVSPNVILFEIRSAPARGFEIALEDRVESAARETSGQGLPGQGDAKGGLCPIPPLRTRSNPEECPEIEAAG